MNDEDFYLLKIRKYSISPKPGCFENEFNYVYTLKIDRSAEEMLLSDETDDIKFISTDELANDVKKFPDKYAPSLDYILEIVSFVQGS